MARTPIRFIRRGTGQPVPGLGYEPETIWLVHERFDGWEFGVEFTDSAQVSGLYTRAAVDINHPDNPSRDFNRRPLIRALPEVMTTRFMRSIPWQEIEEGARTHLRRAREQALFDAASLWTAQDAAGEPVGSGPLVQGGGPGGPAESIASDMVKALDVPRARSGPVPLPDEDLVRFAAAYVKAREDPATSKSAIRTVAAQLGYTESTVRGKISECRRRGLLTQTTRGRSGGELTDKAIDLLNREQQ
jgi:hypothetical protein